MSHGIEAKEKRRGRATVLLQGVDIDSAKVYASILGHFSIYTWAS